MGLGDDIMLTAKARSIFEKTGKKMYPSHQGRLAWSPIFDHNPHMTKNPKEGIDFEIRPRPYAHGHFVDKRGPFVSLRPTTLKPGVFFFNDTEKAEISKLAPFEKYCTIEPNSKQSVYSTNKEWGIPKWQELVNRNPEIKWVQPVMKGKPVLDNVHVVYTSVRIAFGIIGSAKFHVGTEGGTIHAATAQGVKSVAIFGGLSAPWATGYGSNINVYCDVPGSPCGMKIPCQHCKKCMEMITVDTIDAHVKTLRETHYV